MFAICDSVVDPKHFDADLRPAVSFIKEYHKTYRNIPDATLVGAETGVALQQQTISRDKLEYCVTEVERFARQRAIVLAINESADLLAREDYGQLELKLKSAINVSVTKDLGLSLFSDPLAVLRRIAESEKPISTGYEDLDKKLFGGLIRKQLFVISGPSGGGKSLTMANLALNYVESGHNVLMITLEMSEEMNYLRLASMISGIGQNGWFMNIDAIAERVTHYQSVYGNGDRGNLFIKRLPQGARPSQIRSILKEFELIHGAPPDVLVVDYIDIMGPDVKVSPENIHLKDKYVTEGLRELCIDFNMIGISGSQITKGAQAEVDINQSQIAGGQTKLNTVDVFGNVMLTEEMKAAGVVGIKLLKTRTSDGKDKVVFMKFDPISLRFTNFDGSLSDSQVAMFGSLVKKANKTKDTRHSQTQPGVPDAPASTPPTTSKSIQQSWIDQVRAGDQ